MKKEHWKIDKVNFIGMIAIVIIVMTLFAQGIHIWGDAVADAHRHEEDIFNDIIADILIGVLIVFSFFIMAFYYRKFRLSERLVKESEAKFRALVESSPDCIKFLDLNGALSYLSPGGMKEHGIAESKDAVGADWVATIKPEFQGAVRAALRSAKNGATTTLEVEHVPDMSNREWCLLTVAPIYGPQGMIANLIGISRDITAIKQAQKQIWRDKQLLERFLESMADGVVAIDRAWNVTLWNREAGAIAGVPEREATGKPLRDIVKFISETDRRENISFIDEAMLYQKTSHLMGRMLLMRADGTEVPVEGSAAAITDEAGNVTGAIVIFSDASKKRDMQMVSSEFAYASHQIRTPVTEAMWSMELAMRETDAQEAKKRIQEAFDAMKSVKKLASELVEAIALEQGMVVVERKEESAKKIIDTALVIVAGLAETAGVVIKTNYEDEGVMPATDINLAGRIVAELLENAIQHSAAGQEVVVRAMRSDDHIIIEVKDFGEGILPEQQPLVFTKFFRGVDMAHHRIPGAGLGLYVAYRYSKMLGGKLWFSSAVGEGTTFYFSLPIAGEKKENKQTNGV